MTLQIYLQYFLMGPTKPPISSRVMIKDEKHLQDRHPSDGHWPKASNVTLVHLRAVTKHLLPSLPLKGQLTISPSPKRYKERMNITINVLTDKERGAYTYTEICIYKQEPQRGKGKNTHRIL